MNRNTNILDSAAIPLIAILMSATTGVIIQHQTFLSTACFAIMCGYCLLSIFRMRRNNLATMIILFVLIQYIYYLFAPDIIYSKIGGFKETSGRIKAIIINFVPFFITYYYSSIGKLNKKHIIYYSLLYALLLIPKYYFERNYALEMLAEMGRFYDDVTVNMGYYFVEVLVFLPLISSKKILNLLTLAVCGFFIILSAKRGAILDFIVILLLYLPYFLRESKKMAIPLVVILSIVIFVALNFFSQDAYLMGRIEATQNGYVSGRDEIFSDIWRYCMVDHLDLLTFLFGFGFAASMTMTQNVAHNDWLELLADNGLIGIAVYISFFVILIKSYTKMDDEELKKCMQLVIVGWFIKTFFSMAFTSLWYWPLFIGFIIGHDKYLKSSARNKSSVIEGNIANSHKV